MSTTEESRRPPPGGGSLRLRVLSSALLAPSALGATFLGGPLFAAVVAFAAILMVFEWTRMIEGREFSPLFYVQSVIGAAAFAFAAAGFYGLAIGLCAAAAIGGGAVVWRGSHRVLWAIFGAVYILAPSVALIWLRMAVENGRALTLMLFLIVWAADSGGYLGGRLVGGPKMNPVVSPAKTWAGAVGGVIMGALAGLLVSIWIFGGGEYGFYIVAGACLGLASILGDMAESAFKRTFGLKDVSGFIPGHGGVLDRLDGMIFATTAMTLTLYFHMLFGRWQG